MDVRLGNYYFNDLALENVLSLEKGSLDAQLPKTIYKEAALVAKLFIELSLLDIAIESWHKFRETLEEQAQRANESERVHRQKHEEKEGAYREHVWLCPYIRPLA